MDLRNAVVLITGSGGGIGKAAIQALLEAGVTKIYATTRLEGTDVGVDDPRLVKLALDVTDQASIAAAARQCSDVTVLINNAGVNFNAPVLDPLDTEWARHEIEVNYLGSLSVTRAFAPVLVANGGGTVVNVLSILSRVNHPGMATYCASKAALYSATQAMRAQLGKLGTHVLAFMPGAVDTRLTAHLDIPKLTTEETAGALVDAVRDDIHDAYPGDMASAVAAGLAEDHKAVEAMFAEFI